MRRRKNIAAVFLFLVSAYCVCAGAQSPAQGAPRLVHYGDLIEVDVIGSFEFDWRGTLNPEGFLDGIDHIDTPVYALCRPESDIAGALEKQFAKLLRDPKVEVRIIDRSNRAAVFLDGAVRSPQRFQIKRTIRLNELLVLAGGITDSASGEISVFRPPNLSCDSRPKEPVEEFVKTSREAAPETLRIKIADLLRGQIDANPTILSGDIITVVEASPIYVIGGVNSPNQISSRSQTTLSRAIDSAGGLSKSAESEKVTIYRREGTQTRTIVADLGRIRAGEADDPALKPFDIVEVPQKGRSKNSRPPVIDSRADRRNSPGKLPLRVVD